MSYATEIFQHHQTFEKLKQFLSRSCSGRWTCSCWWKPKSRKILRRPARNCLIRKNRSLDLRFMVRGGRHYSFKGILHNYGIVPRADLVAKVKP
jgi:hypothetical protein